MSRRVSRMRPADALAWNLGRDDPVLRAVMVGVVRLDRRPDWPTLQDRVERWSRTEPRLRQVVRTLPLHTTPVWRDDTAFDLDFHLRRLAAPADEDPWREVLQLVSLEMMAGFDPVRPLWRFTLVEGLADGGAALVCTVHHALADGLGALALGSMLADPGVSGAGPPARESRPASPVGGLVTAVREDVDAVRAVASAAWRQAPAIAAAAATRPVRTAWDIASSASSVARLVAPVPRASSSEFGSRNVRRVADVLTVPQRRLAEAARVSGVHLNDAFLAAVTDGVHRYHVAVGAPLETVRVTVPVSQRDATDSPASNRITLLRMQFPARVDDPGRRMRRVATVSSRWLHEPALAWTDPIAVGLGLVPRAYLSQVFERVEVLASNVHGPAASMSIAGVEVGAIFPFGPTLGAAANVTLLTYRGTAHVGVVVDPDAVAEPPLLVSSLSDAFDGVLRAGRSRRASANGRARR